MACTYKRTKKKSALASYVSLPFHVQLLTLFFICFWALRDICTYYVYHLANYTSMRQRENETWNCAECMCWSEVSSYMLKTMIDYIIIETLVYLWFLIYNCHPAIVITFRTPSSSLPLGRFISIVFTFCCCHGRLVFCKSKCTCYSYQLVIRLIWMVNSSDTFKTRDIWRKKIVFFFNSFESPSFVMEIGLQTKNGTIDLYCTIRRKFFRKLRSIENAERIFFVADTLITI